MPPDDDGVIQSRLVAYASQQAHSSAERAALLGGVKVRLLEVDEDYSLRGETLANAIEEDRAKVMIGLLIYKQMSRNRQQGSLIPVL